MQPYPDDRLIAQGDREYELVHNNTHPFQLELYELVNKRLQEEKEDQAIRENGGKPLDDQFIEIASERIHKAAETKGEDLNAQDLHKILEDVFKSYMIAQGSETSRNHVGDFKDFVEFRRPYIEPGVNNVSVKVN